MCRAYKAVISFAAVGVVAALGAVGLDVWVLRRGARRGRFVSLALDGDEGVWDAEPTLALRAGGYAVPGEQFGDGDIGYAGAGGRLGERL